jgi:hypothetical protein
MRISALKFVLQTFTTCTLITLYDLHIVKLAYIVCTSPSQWAEQECYTLTVFLGVFYGVVAYMTIQIDLAGGIDAMWWQLISSPS